MREEVARRREVLQFHTLQLPTCSSSSSRFSHAGFTRALRLTLAAFDLHIQRCSSFLSATLASCIVKPGLVIERQARRDVGAGRLGGSGEDGGGLADRGEGAVGPVFAREGGELRAPSSSVHQSASYLSR